MDWLLYVNVSWVWRVKICVLYRCIKIYLTKQSVQSVSTVEMFNKVSGALKNSGLLLVIKWSFIRKLEIIGIGQIRIREVRRIIVVLPGFRPRRKLICWRFTLFIVLVRHCEQGTRRNSLIPREVRPVSHAGQLQFIEVQNWGERAKQIILPET